MTRKTVLEESDAVVIKDFFSTAIELWQEPLRVPTPEDEARLDALAVRVADISDRGLNALSELLDLAEDTVIVLGMARVTAALGRYVGGRPWPTSPE